MKKKIILLLAFLTTLTVFGSMAVSQSTQTITISNTKLILLSNTEQCLVDCEAWIEFDLSQSLTGFKVPTSPNTLFKMEFEKKNQDNKSLTDYGLEVWENVGRNVNDYCPIPTKYIYYNDLNAKSPTCASIGCSDKGQYCECDTITSKICGSHTIYEWKRADDFYNFTFEAGKVYRMRIWGKRKPSLESGGIDWIPTFFGQEIRQWAWWDTDWDYKTNFTITANQDLNAGYSLDLNAEMFDFTSKIEAGKMRSDHGDIRVIYSDTDEMLFHYEDDNSNDFNVLWISSPIGLSATDTISFDIYYGNAAAEHAGADLNSPAMDNNVYAYFRLEENAANTIVYDYSGNNRDANSLINTSGMTFEGKYKQSLGDFADDSTNINMRGNLDGMTEGTIDFFMNRESGDGGQHIFGYYTAAPIEGIDIAVDTQGDVVWQNVVGGAVKWEIGNNLATTPIAEWTHIMVTWGAAGAQICVNGQVKAVNADTSALATVTVPLLIGARNYEGSLVQEFDGELDEFRIRNVQIDCNSIYQYYPEVNLEGIATVTNVASEEEAPPETAITDLNLFGHNLYDKEIDLNIDSDTNVVFDINITGIDLNYDSIIVYYHSIETGDSNRYGFIRADAQFGWKEESTDDISWTVLLTDGDTNHTRSDSEDDHAYKQWSYNLDPENFEEKDGSHVLNSGNDWLRTLITNVPPDKNVFYNFSFSANYSGVGTKTLTVYDCNNQAANPMDDTGCNSFEFESTSLKEADEYYSIKLTSNDQNQLVADQNVNMNLDGNHWLYFNCSICSATKTWAIDYINQNSNVDRTRNWLSSTGLAGFATEATTIDAHIHWQRLDYSNFFDWIVQISKNDAAGDTNSVMKRHEIIAANIPPTIGDFNSPQERTYYNGTIDVNVSVFDSHEGVLEDGLVCDMNILNSLLLPIAQISFNQPAAERSDNGGFHCTSTYDTTLQADGNYSITLRLRETLTPDLFSVDKNMLDFFFIDNNAPVALDWFLSTDLNDSAKNLTFWIQLSDAGIGAKGAWYGLYKNGVLDSNNFVEVNATGFANTNVSLDANGDTAQIIWYVLTDDLDNNSELVIQSGLYTRIDPTPSPTQRYFSQDDPRVIDQDRYLAWDDVRAKQLTQIDSERFVIQETSQQPIELYLTIGVILLASTFLAVIFLIRRKR